LEKQDVYILVLMVAGRVEKHVVRHVKKYEALLVFFFN